MSLISNLQLFVDFKGQTGNSYCKKIEIIPCNCCAFSMKQNLHIREIYFHNEFSEENLFISLVKTIHDGHVYLCQLWMILFLSWVALEAFACLTYVQNFFDNMHSFLQFNNAWIVLIMRHLFATVWYVSLVKWIISAILPSFNGLHLPIYNAILSCHYWQRSARHTFYLTIDLLSKT